MYKTCAVSSGNRPPLQGKAIATAQTYCIQRHQHVAQTSGPKPRGTKSMTGLQYKMVLDIDHRLQTASVKIAVVEPTTADVRPSLSIIHSQALRPRSLRSSRRRRSNAEASIAGSRAGKGKGHGNDGACCCELYGAKCKSGEGRRYVSTSRAGGSIILRSQPAKLEFEGRCTFGTRGRGCGGTGCASSSR